MRYVVFARGINAFSIEKGLKRLGLAAEYDPLLGAPGETAGAAEVVGFFTEEASLQNAMRTQSCTFEPRDFALPVDDKLEFSRILQSWGELVPDYAEVPEILQSTTFPALPFCIKGRRSWAGSVRMPRGYVCRSPKEFAAIMERIERSGWRRDDFFLQTFIDGPVSNSFSACGYFDVVNPSRNAILVTRKLLGYGGDLPTGGVVETVDDPSDLLERTNRILARANYTGPFELEFIRDPRTRQYYALELNPRFWMQHGLFVDFFENALIKRYVGLDKTESGGVPPFRKCLWISSEAILLYVWKRDLSNLARFVEILLRSTGHRVTVYPSAARVLESMGKSLWRKAIHSCTGHRRPGSPPEAVRGQP